MSAHLRRVGLADVVDSDPVVPGVLPAPGRKVALVLHDARVLLRHAHALLRGLDGRVCGGHLLRRRLDGRLGSLGRQAAADATVATPGSHLPPGARRGR